VKKLVAFQQVTGIYKFSIADLQYFNAFLAASFIFITVAEKMAPLI
jgi:hypothetical protein